MSKNSETGMKEETFDTDTREAAVAKLREWDPRWADACLKVTSDPWTSGVLPRKAAELIRVALSAAWTNLNPGGTRRHIRAALEAGATREQVLLVLKMAAVMSIDACSLVMPVLFEEATESDLDAVAAGRSRRLKEAEGTPNVDRVKADGRWSTVWDPFYDLAPVWTDKFAELLIGIYESTDLSQKEMQLLSIALDTSYTHMYAPGTRRHIRNALRAGATVDEIMAVLKLCVLQGFDACSVGVPILAEEVAERPAAK